MEKLKSCPCGETPKSLLLVDNGAKWAYATGDCCNEWHVEFRTGYNKLESSECMALAIEAWNLATRKPPNTGLQTDALVRCVHCNALIETDVHCDNCGSFHPTRR
jgi:hypothetical protein